MTWELIFLEYGVKIHRNKPCTDHFGPVFFWPEDVLSLHSKGLEKAQKQSKIALFGNPMLSIASLSPGLWFRIHL